MSSVAEGKGVEVASDPVSQEVFPAPPGTPESMSIRASRTRSDGLYLLESATQRYLGFSGRIDEKTAPSAIDFLVSGVVTCAIGLINKAAQASEEDIGELQVAATVWNDLEDGTRFRGIDLLFEFAELDEERAAEYIRLFAQLCPIYNTVVQGTDIRLYLNHVSEESRLD